LFITIAAPSPFYAMAILRGRRAAWKGPFFVPFNLPKLNPTTASSNTPVQPTINATTAPSKPPPGKASGKSSKNKSSPASTPVQPVTQHQLRTQARNCTILPSFVGHTFHVHNGKDYLPVRVTEEMIGHRLGEFSFTKKPAVFGASSKKK
jgi:ribosomal protein S19